MAPIGGEAVLPLLLHLLAATVAALAVVLVQQWPPLPIFPLIAPQHWTAHVFKQLESKPQTGLHIAITRPPDIECISHQLRAPAAKSRVAGIQDIVYIPCTSSSIPPSAPLSAAVSALFDGLIPCSLSPRTPSLMSL